MSTDPAAAELVDEQPPAIPVSIHVGGNVWHAGDLANASGDTWRDELADLLCEVAAQLRGQTDAAPADPDVDQS